MAEGRVGHEEKETNAKRSSEYAPTCCDASKSRQRDGGKRPQYCLFLAVIPLTPTVKTGTSLQHGDVIAAGANFSVFTFLRACSHVVRGARDW